MWNNLSAPAKQVTPAPAPEPINPGADDFYGTLDLGQEAQINQDLVRTIRAEIVEIDDGLRVTSRNVTSEERSHGQLTKNSHHTRGEMFYYRRDAAEVLDLENMTEDLRLGFKDQFALEIAPHVVSPPARAAGDGDGDPAREGSVGARAFSHKQFIDRKRASAKAKAASVNSIQKEIKSTRKKIKAMDDEAANYVKDMEARQLDKIKLEGERQVEARRREYEAESQRNRGIKEAVKIARANSGAFAQQIADKAKVQISERGNHVAKEAALASLDEAKRQELDLVVSEERQAERELAVLSDQLDFLIKQATDFEAEQARADKVDAEIKEVQEKINEVVVSKDTKLKEAEASKADLQSATVASENASKAMADATAAKLENDTAVLEVLKPALARKADATKEKENLASEVVTLQSSLEQARNKNEDAVASSKAKIAAKTQELKDRKDKLDKAHDDLLALKRDDAAALATLSSELSEYNKFAAKFEEATKAELAGLELSKKDRTSERVKRLEIRRSELNAIEDAQQNDVEYFKELNVFLQRMTEEKIEIENTEITSDEIEANRDNKTANGPNL